MTYTTKITTITWILNLRVDFCTILAKAIRKIRI